MLPTERSTKVATGYRYAAYVEDVLTISEFISTDKTVPQHHRLDGCFSTSVVADERLV